MTFLSLTSQTVRGTPRLRHRSCSRTSSHQGCPRLMCAPTATNGNQTKHNQGWDHCAVGSNGEERLWRPENDFNVRTAEATQATNNKDNINGSITNNGQHQQEQHSTATAAAASPSNGSSRSHRSSRSRSSSSNNETSPAELQNMLTDAAVLTVAHEHQYCLLGEPSSSKTLLCDHHFHLVAGESRRVAPHSPKSANEKGERVCIDFFHDHGCHSAKKQYH